MPTFLAYLRDLNIFQSKDDRNINAYEYHSNKLATRVYLIGFTCIIISITIALSLVLQPETNNIISPTKQQFDLLPQNAQCPCTQLSFAYGTFLTVQVRFHKICSSDFISDRWINTIFSHFINDSYYVADFRLIGSAHFQVLKSLCQLISQYLNDRLQTLYSSSFVSSKALDKNGLQSTIDGLMQDFQLNVPLIFKSRLELITQLMFSNQLLPALDSTFDLSYYNDDQSINNTQISTNIRTIVNDDGSSCFCYYSYDCKEQSGIYYQNKTFPTFYHRLLVEIKGFYAGCTSINALLQSTLESFYNQSCLDEIFDYLPYENNFTALTTSNNTRFLINSTIQSMVNELMLEELIYNISHENYYKQCKPHICTYVQIERNSFYHILTTIIGLLGGLTLALQNLIPTIVHYLRNRNLDKNKPKEKFNIRKIIIRFKSYSTQQLIELNLFKNQQTDEYSIRYQIYTTRLYAILLSLSFVIIFIYFLSTKQTYREIVNNPNQSEYNHLKELYSTSIQCSCNELSQSYENFLSVEPIYHPICSSDFLSTDWLNLMSIFTDVKTIANLKYSINFFGQFNILKTFCENAQDTIVDARQAFLQTKYISIQLIDENYFLNEISSTIDNWKTNTNNRYGRIVQLIRETNQGNKLINFQYNTNFLLNQTVNQFYYKSLNYSNCSCDLYGSCSMPISYTPPSAFGSLGVLVPFEIPNFLTGCFPVESLLQSTLQCFTDQTCLNSLLQKLAATIRILDIPIRMNFSILYISNQKQNQTIESIVQELMVDFWTENISYSTYYNTCSPTCTYETLRQRNILTIVTTIISVLGGLATIFEIFMLIFIRLIEELPNIRSYEYVFILIKQRSSNKLKFILFLLLIIIFYLVSFLTPQIKTVSIDVNENLQCFCSKPLNNYETFVHIQAQLHPICSSYLMSNNWIEYISTQKTDQLGQYQLLISFCQLAENIINNTLSQFARTNYVSSQLISSKIFNQTIEYNFEQFQKENINEFLNMLDIIRQITASNMLLNKYSTNWKYNVNPLSSRYFEYFTSSVKYQDCDCGTSSTCTQVLSNKNIVGCYPLESLLKSTVQYFDQQNCTDPFGNYTSSNETIQVLLENLFVEQYLLDISYEKYFNACSTSYCTYSYNGYGNIIDTIILLIGLYGGLTILSEWITLGIMKLYKIRQRRIHALA